MMAFRSDAPQACGIVKLNEKGVMQNFYEKVRNPPGNFASGAVFILSPVALSRINKMPANSDFSRDVISEFLGEINTWENRCYHRDIGSPYDYERAKREFRLVASRYRTLR
jgi:mannose-1-phosphate guanylyltransferase